MNVNDFIEGKTRPSTQSEALRRVVMNLEASLYAEVENAMATSEEGFEDGDSVIVEDRLGDMRLVFLSYYYSMCDGDCVWIPTFTSIIRVEGTIRYMSASDSEEFIEKLIHVFKLDEPETPSEPES